MRELTMPGTLDLEAMSTFTGQEVGPRRVPIPDYYIQWWNVMNSMGVASTNITHLVAKFQGNCDLEAWRRSIEWTIERHPILNVKVAARANALEFILAREF